MAFQLLVFYGSEDDDVDRWLHRVERVAVVNDNIKLLVATSKLQKLARDWYDMDERSMDSWFAFKEALIRRFRQQVSFIMMIQKADSYHWNSSKALWTSLRRRLSYFNLYILNNEVLSIC